MSERSHLTVRLHHTPEPLPRRLARILDGHDHHEQTGHSSEFVWEETRLERGAQIATDLHRADPALEFTCQQEGHHDADGYRITATTGQGLREVTITPSGCVVANPHTIADLLNAATTLTGARAAVAGYLDAEGAL